MNDLIVFSHLRWEFVWQRPQHIISRLGKSRKVLFVEEPIDGETKIIKHGNVSVVQPRIGTTVSFDEYTKPMVWFYSPMFIEQLDKITDPDLVVFDVMDQLSAFKGAPKELLDKEKELFRRADVVFTGGKSLFEEKKKQHDNVFCFPSSVDLDHFLKATKKETEIPLDVKNIKGPIAGYYGVIDERVDLGLLKETAQLLPDVSFVMIGPVVKISEDELPRERNIYYLGGKKYEELPNYLKAIDVSIMPFALNESTKFISPTKTLEYMAAGKPIVSTPIYDVVRDYSQVVEIVKDAEEFKKAIKYFLGEGRDAQEERLKKQQAILEKTSWDKTVLEMEKILKEESAKKKLIMPKNNKLNNFLAINYED